MDFYSQEMKRHGAGWMARVWTVQDLEADPSGQTIYAIGEITIGHHGRPEVQTLDNRGFSIVEGRRIYRPPFYKMEDSQRCLQQMLQKLVAVGLQHA